MENTVLKNLNLICNISNTKYEIIKEVINFLSWKTSEDEETMDWDVFWTDNAVAPEKLAKMKHYQRINHFPGMYLISRKNYLAYNLGKLRKLFSEDYSFFPKTWMFPNESCDLKNYMQMAKASYFIVKPEASCQGRGIFLTRKIDDISPSEKYVVQEYIASPFLIDGLKFDLRVYVLVTSCDPLRIFIHEEGLTRFATELYERPTAKNSEVTQMHLTNYAINKNSLNFIHNTNHQKDNIGHKRSLKSTYDYLQDQGYDTELLKSQIEDIVIKTLCTIQPNLSHHYHACQPEDLTKAMCFEVLGFDIILNDKAKPYMLEVNHSPSFSTDSPLDRKIKHKVISDSLNLAWVSVANRVKYHRKLKNSVNKRAISGKVDRVSKEEREVIMKKFREIRDLHEATHKGGFKKIYPNDGENYEKYIKAADSAWQEWTGAKNNQLVKQRITPNMQKSVFSFQRPIIKSISKQLSRKHLYTSFEANGTSVFDRLSQPVIRQVKAANNGILPGIVYDKKKIGNCEIPRQISNLTETSECSIKNEFQKPTEISVTVLKRKKISTKTLKEFFLNAPIGRYKTRLLNYLLK